MRPNFASSSMISSTASPGWMFCAIVGDLGRHEQRRRLAADDDLSRHCWPDGDRRTHGMRGRVIRAEVVSDRQVQREAAALARRALDRDLAAEQATDLAADRQTEARAAVLAAGGAVGLLERFEDHAQLVGGDADAGVGDRKGDDGRARALSASFRDSSRRSRARCSAPRRRWSRELERVRQQILQDLLQAFLVGDDRARQLRIERDRQARGSCRSRSARSRAAGRRRPRRTAPCRRRA